MDLTGFGNIGVPIGLLGVKVSQGNKVLAHVCWDEESRRNCYSVTKSVTATAVGFALQEGLLRLDEKLTDAFCDELPPTVDENLAKATVRDLLTMCLGQGKGFLTGDARPRYPEDNWVKLSLAQPFVYAPGTCFVYNNAGPYLAGVLIQRRAKCSLTEYLLPRLFLPLGIKRPTWEVDPVGYNFGGSGLALTLSELHKLGQFWLDGGVWEGRRLLPEDWIAACATPQSIVNYYGYLFWLGEHESFRADGLYSQFVFMFPKRDAVVTVVSYCRDAERLRRAVYSEIYPQLS